MNGWTGFSPERLRFSVKPDRDDFWVRDRDTRDLRLLTHAEWDAVMPPRDEGDNEPADQPDAVRGGQR